MQQQHGAHVHSRSAPASGEAVPSKGLQREDVESRVLRESLRRLFPRYTQETALFGRRSMAAFPGSFASTTHTRERGTELPNHRERRSHGMHGRKPRMPPSLSSSSECEEDDINSDRDFTNETTISIAECTAFNDAIFPTSLAIEKNPITSKYVLPPHLSGGQGGAPSERNRSMAPMTTATSDGTAHNTFKVVQPPRDGNAMIAGGSADAIISQQMLRESSRSRDTLRDRPAWCNTISMHGRDNDSSDVTLAGLGDDAMEDARCANDPPFDYDDGNFDCSGSFEEMKALVDRVHSENNAGTSEEADVVHKPHRPPAPTPGAMMRRARGSDDDDASARRDAMLRRSGAASGRWSVGNEFL